MAQPRIHGFYRVWFTWVDPIVLLPTAFTCIFAPDLMMDNFIPAKISGPNPDHGFLFHQLAALYLLTGAVLAGVLRASPDIKVWRLIEGSVLCVDIALIASLYASLSHQGRLELVEWRWQDWANLLFTGWVAILRGLFLAGVGVGSEVVGKKKA